MMKLLLALLVASSSGAVLKPTAVPKPATKQLLALRGGASLPDIALAANGIYYGALGAMSVFVPNQILAMNKLPAEDFLSPAIGIFQYYGAACLCTALRVYAALVAGVRDPKQTLEALIYWNGVFTTVAAFRVFKGSKPSQKILVFSAVLGTLAYFGHGAA